MFPENIVSASTHMKKEAVKALTEKPIITYTAERVRLWSEVAKEVAGESCQPLRIGKGMKSFLSRVSIPVSDYDILIGRATEESFSEEEEKTFREKYINDCMRFDGIPKFLYDGGHQSFDWNRLIKVGLPALRKEAEDALGRYKANGTKQQCDWLSGAVMIYDSFICFLNRSAEAAEAAGLTESAAVCRAVASGAPSSFWEALQLVYTIEFVFCAYISPNPTLALGRLDLFLGGLYGSDIASGRLTREYAGLLIDDFYAKNNLIMGRGEHQLSARTDMSKCTGWNRILCYDAPQYLTLSGADPDSGKAVAGDLTALFIEHIEPKYKNPVIVFRYSKGFAAEHHDIWKTLVGKMRASASILIYNDIPVCRMYTDRGDSLRDAMSYEYFGCNWPTLPATDACDYDYVFRHVNRNIVPFEMQALENLRLSGAEISRQALLDSMHDEMKKAFEKIRDEGKPLSNGPDPRLLTIYACFARGNIERAGRYFDRINVILPLGGLGTLIDIASAADHVCIDLKIPLGRLLDACRNNFVGEEKLLAICKNSPKLGDGSETSSFYADRLINTIADAYDEVFSVGLPDYCRLRLCGEADTWHNEIGASLGATPDGRLCGQPTSQNCQPSPGAAKNGITAMFDSLAHIPFYRFASGAMNVTIQTSSFAGEAGLENLARLFSVYFERGGLQLQLSAVDRELLEDAQKNPDAHRDLMVRVTGYSAVFTDMSKVSQDDFMSRNSF